MSHMSFNTLAFLMMASLIINANANAFLKANSHLKEESISFDDVTTNLLSEVEDAFGAGTAGSRVAQLQQDLAPIYAALPKNERGNLGHATVRYALHRVFIQRHGWSITGIDAAGEAWNSSSPTGILKDHVTSFIQKMFEDRLQGRGLGVQELAIFAATIEHLIHNEATTRLGSALTIHALSPTSLFTVAQVEKVLDSYMMAYIVGEKLEAMNLHQATMVVAQMHTIFLMWKETQVWFRKVRQDVSAAVSKGHPDGQIDFATFVKIVETIGEQFGTFQDAECKGLKSQLMKMEDRGSGRVRLSDFYGPAHAGGDDSWQFQESRAHLLQIGALDESKSDEARVIMTNYLYAKTNCIASSDFYSVCCMDECEDLMQHLEKTIAAPEAKPERIIQLITGLPSTSVTAPRTLSPTLLIRLQDIADHHGGTVQLHGRLFAQWMHHAYPRECPFPHVTGTTSQAGPTDGSDIATTEEMKQFVEARKSTIEEVDDHHDLMMWTHEEELLMARPVPTGGSSYIRGIVYLVVIASMISVGSGLLQTSLGACKPKSKSAWMGNNEKFMV